MLTSLARRFHTGLRSLDDEITLELGRLRVNADVTRPDVIEKILELVARSQAPSGSATERVRVRPPYSSTARDPPLQRIQ